MPASPDPPPKLQWTRSDLDRKLDQVCLSLSVPFVLSVLKTKISLTHSLILSLVCSLSLSVSFFFTCCMSVCLSVCRSVCLSFCLSVCLSVYHSISLSSSPCLYLSLCLSLALCLFTVSCLLSLSPYANMHRRPMTSPTYSVRKSTSKSGVKKMTHMNLF